MTPLLATTTAASSSSAEPGSSTASLRTVRKRYRDDLPWVLDGVDLEIRSGELLAIVGESGSGKTTLLNLLGCVDRPTSGRVMLGGVDLTGLDDAGLAHVRHSRIGMIFQQYHLVDHLDVFQNVELRFLYGRDPVPDDVDERIHRLLESLGIAPLASRSPRDLSGGEAQRVAIARALVSEPQLLLADEPTGNLDQRNGRRVFELLEEVAAAGTAVVLVTHDPRLAARCPRTLVLREGRLGVA